MLVEHYYLATSACKRVQSDGGGGRHALGKHRRRYPRASCECNKLHVPCNASVQSCKRTGLCAVVKGASACLFQNVGCARSPCCVYITFYHSERTHAAMSGDSKCTKMGGSFVFGKLAYSRTYKDVKCFLLYESNNFKNITKLFIQSTLQNSNIAAQTSQTVSQSARIYGGTETL